MTYSKMTHAVIVTLMLVAAGCGGFGGATPGTEDMSMGPAPVQAKFSSLYTDYFANCSGCHTPTALGRTSDTEQTMDWSTAAIAHSKLTTGTASGLTGNAMACNGVSFIGTTSAASLVVAVLDQATRTAYDNAQFPNCDATAISDMTLKVGTQPSAAFVVALKQWIDAGAAND